MKTDTDTAWAASAKAAPLGAGRLAGRVSAVAAAG
jgi:hypothetical protein